MKAKFPFAATLVPPTLLYALSFVFMVTGLYDRYSFLDIPMHAAGGAIIGFGVFFLFGWLRSRKYVGAMHPAVEAVCLTGIVMLVAVVWEWHEFVLDTYFATRHQGGLADTMLDFFLGFLGGFFTSVILLVYKRKK